MEEKKNIYVGHRYVPKVMGQWDSTQNYEGLSIVIHQGDSYTSKKHVPAGIDIYNDEFWVITGNYNAQISDYQNRVSSVEDLIDDKADISYVDGEVDTLNTSINQKADTSYVDGEVAGLNTSINTKADKSYVDSEVDTLNTSINQKADTSYVDSEIEDINDMMDFKVTKTTENIEYHVETNGNDNNSGNSSNPFRTIAKAISMIPDVIGEDYSFIITIGNGSWNENISISNKTVNGSLEVRGATTDTENHSVNLCSFRNITGHLTVRNIHARTSTTVAFRFQRCTYAFCTNVMALGDPNGDTGVEGNHGLLADYGSNVLVSGSEFSNKRHGIRVNYLSKIFSDNNRGSNNVYGISARWGGQMHARLNQPTGTTNRSIDSSGLIINSGSFLGQVEPNFYLRHENSMSPSNVDRVSRRNYQFGTINNASRPIEANEQLVLEFVTVGNGTITIDFRYGGAMSHSTYNFIRGVYSAYLTTNLHRPNMDIIASNGMTADDVDVTHIGNNRFELRIRPTSALSGNWGVEVDVQMLRRNNSAPRLEDVRIETI